jgi:hypothetical protein
MTETSTLIEDALLEIRTADPSAKEIYSGEFARVFHLPARYTAICVLTATYVPIADFKLLFYTIAEDIKRYQITRFIFDKRALRTFHQPSMEWYFVHWKQEMYKHNLTTYRKLLPQDKWFEQAVMIGKAKILSSYPDTIIPQLDIRYCQSIQQALTT